MFTVICDSGDEAIDLKSFSTREEAERYKTQLEEGFLFQGRRPPDLFIKENAA